MIWTVIGLAYPAALVVIDIYITISGRLSRQEGRGGADDPQGRRAVNYSLEPTNDRYRQKG